MSRRSLTLLAVLAVLGVAWFGMPTMTGATFSSTSRNTASVTAAADWTPPTVAVTNPGTTVKDTVSITATASDAQTGIANVVVQFLAPGATSWTTLCTATTAPYSCSWNTKLVADGSYGLRAIATDNAGYQTTSDTVTTTVANNFLVVLNDPGSIVRGNVTLSSSIYNAGSLVYVQTVQYLVTGTTGTWRTLCTMSVTAPYTCVWATTGNSYTQGESYDLRVMATSGTTTVYSAVVGDVLIDNVAPTVTMTDPGTPLSGTATFAATAADADAGVTSVQLQYQKLGTSTWTTFCTISIDPYTCRYDTTKLSDGSYSFRAVATDGAGNTTTSTTIAGRVVDNTVSSVSMEDPGAYLAGTVTLSANASSTAGVTSVRIDRAPSGTTTWTTVCTDTTAPYTCGLDTTTLADGLYDFRAVLVDGAAKTTTSATMAARRIDNSPLKGYDVQTTNGGATAGKVEAGDKLTLTYTDQVALGSILNGWTGGTANITMRLRDGNAVGGLGGSNDTVDFFSGSTQLALGSVNLKANLIKNNKTATFNATMVASTTTVNGTTATVVTITLGNLASGGSLRTATSSTLAVWTPSVSALDLNGRPCSAATVTERGAANKEF